MFRSILLAIVLMSSVVLGGETINNTWFPGVHYSTCIVVDSGNHPVEGLRIGCNNSYTSSHYWDTVYSRGDGRASIPFDTSKDSTYIFTRVTPNNAYVNFEATNACQTHNIKPYSRRDNSDLNLGIFWVLSLVPTRPVSPADADTGFGSPKPLVLKWSWNPYAASYRLKYWKVGSTDTTTIIPDTMHTDSTCSYTPTNLEKGTTYGWYVVNVMPSRISTSGALPSSLSPDSIGFISKAHTKRTFKMGTPVTITTQPTSVTVNANSTATFTIAASNAASYQWKLNGLDISGATSSSYTTPVVDFTNNSSVYSCVVSNVYDTLTSNSATLTVNKLNQSITFNDQSVIYGGSLVGASGYNTTITYFSNNTAVVAHDLKVVGDGSASVTVTAEATTVYNAASVTKTIMVAKKNLTISGMTASNKVYDGTTAATLVGGTLSGMENSDVISFTGAVGTFSSKDAGNSLAVTVSGLSLSGIKNSCYTFTNPTGLTAHITKKDLTIKVDDKIWTKDFSPGSNMDPQPSPTCTYNGFVSGESTSSLSGSLAITEDHPTALGQSYEWVPSGLTSTNYEINYQKGLCTVVYTGLHIVDISNTIEFSNKVQVYDGSVKKVGVSNGNDGYIIPLEYSATPINVGSYTVTAKIDTIFKPFREIGTATCTLTISKASQAITFGALASKAMGSGTFNLTATAPAGAVSYSSSSGSVASISGSTVTLVGVGSTTITASQAGSANYNAATSVQQVLVVTEDPAVIEAQRVADSIAAAKKTADSLALIKHIADSTEAKRVADSTEAKRVADSTAAALTKHIADSTEAKRVADSISAALIKHVADSIEAKRVADSTEAKRVADSTEAKRVADSTAAVKKTADSLVAVKKSADSLDASIAPLVTFSDSSKRVWAVSSNNTIAYSATDNVGVVARKISVSIDDGKNWTVLDSGNNNSGSFAVPSPSAAVDKGILRIAAYDAQGTMGYADLKFCAISKPVFTSADSVSINGGSSFAYKITYQFPGNPSSYQDTILSKPDWLNVQGDSIWGTTPRKNQADTVKVKVGTAGVYDTLVLVIYSKMTASISRAFNSNHDYFGVQANSRTLKYGVNAGAYEITVYDMAGRVVFSKRSVGSAGYSMIPVSSNAYVVRLVQGSRSVTHRSIVLR